MTYREPAPRQKRPFYVTISWYKHPSVGAAPRWVWAYESHDAIAEVIAKEDKKTTDVWWFEAICGEDFAEREAKGPPKESK